MRSVSIAAFATCLFMAAAARAETLFDDLGQQPGLTRIVDSATAAWLADPRVAATFENTNITRFKHLLSDQLCQLTGGGCTYHGRPMRESHEALHLTNRQFNAVVEGLQHGMDQQDIPFRTQNRVLALLAPMQHDVVSR